MFPVQAPTTYLAGSGTIIGATSVTVTNFVDIYGNVLDINDFGGTQGQICLEPDTNNEESATFTGITVNANGTYTLTGVKTVLAKYPFTETAGLIRQHAGGQKVVISDTSWFWYQYASKAAANIFSGVNQFTQKLRVGAVTSADLGYAATVDLVNATAIAGAPDAGAAVKGITKTSVAPVSAVNPISVGDNDPRVPTQGENDALVGNNTDIAVGTGNKFVTQTGLQKNAEKYATDTSASSTAYVITLSPVPTSLTNGMIVHAKIVTANTTTTPTLNVNSLGAKTIVKNNNAALVIGDIGANMYCTFIYDSTNTVWVMQNPPVSTFTATTNSNTLALNSGASSSTVVTHSLGVIPKRIQFFFQAATSSGYGEALVNSAGTVLAQNCVGTGKVTDGYAGHPQPFLTNFAMAALSFGGVGANVTVGSVTSTQFTVSAPASITETLTFYWTVSN